MAFPCEGLIGRTVPAPRRTGVRWLRRNRLGNDTGGPHLSSEVTQPDQPKTERVVIGPKILIQLCDCMAGQRVTAPQVYSARQSVSSINW